MNKLAGIKVDSDTVSHKGETWPILGARATVETAGDIERRITATRVVLTAGLGAFWKKKTDHRELYLLVEGPGFSFVEEVNPKKGAEARQFAARINAAGSVAVERSAADAATPVPEPEPNRTIGTSRTTRATSSDQQQFLPVPPKRAWEALEAALTNTTLKVKSTDGVLMRAEVSSGVSAATWGHNFLIQVAPS